MVSFICKLLSLIWKELLSLLFSMFCCICSTIQQFHVFNAFCIPCSTPDWVGILLRNSRSNPNTSRGDSTPSMPAPNINIYNQLLRLPTLGVTASQSGCLFYSSTNHRGQPVLPPHTWGVLTQLNLGNAMAWSIYGWLNTWKLII